MKRLPPLKSRIVFDKEYQNTVKSLKKIKLIGNSSPVVIKMSRTDRNQEGDTKNMEKELVYPLNCKNGEKLIRNYWFGGYDESILSYDTLQGQARGVSHSYVFSNHKIYIPVNFLTLNFYTRSTNIGNSDLIKGNIRIGNDISNEIDKDYYTDREKFLTEHAVENSILFIDGPLFSGLQTSFTFKLVDKLEEKNITTFFLKKNCNSLDLTKSLDDAKGYNSDIHWANSRLKAGERTAFFNYTSNDGRAKSFCYMKMYNKLSPVRIELSHKYYEKHLQEMNNYLDFIFYLFIIQGYKNPQIRPVAIAEMYARETLKLTNIYKDIKTYGLIPTMNEERNMMK